MTTTTSVPGAKAASLSHLDRLISRDENGSSGVLLDDAAIKVSSTRRRRTKPYPRGRFFWPQREELEELIELRAALDRRFPGSHRVHVEAFYLDRDADENAAACPEMLGWRRLAAVLQLLSSDKPGDPPQAAAEAAHRLVERAGLRWQDVLAGPDDKPPPSSSSPWQEMAATARRHADQLTAWEREFVASVSWQASVSNRQFAILVRLARKVTP